MLELWGLGRVGHNEARETTEALIKAPLNYCSMSREWEEPIVTLSQKALTLPNYTLTLSRKKWWPNSFLVWKLQGVGS